MLSDQATTSDGTYTPCRFTGTATEYFRIWVVNLFFSVLTLGIYSAWATVRKRRYIYGNTWFEKSTFDYHGSPISILFIRLLATSTLIVVFALAALTAMRYISADQGVKIAVALFIIVPILRLQTYRYRWRATSLRNVTFGFDGTALQTLALYILWPLLMVLSLLLIYPVFAKKCKHWIVTHSYFGERRFEFSGTAGGVFSICLPLYMALMLTYAAIAVWLHQRGIEVNLEGFLQYLSWDRLLAACLLINFIVWCVLFPYLQARITNYTWNNTSIGNTRFKGSLSAHRLVFIYISNLLAIILSFGVLIPWAKMRITKYRVESVHYCLQDDFSQVRGFSPAMHSGA